MAGMSTARPVTANFDTACTCVKPRAYRIIFAVTLLLLASLLTGASELCSAVHNDNGTTSFFLSKSHCTSYNWLINKIVRANEENYTRTLIESRGPDYITFYRCYENVTFRNTCTRTDVDCSFPCPTEESLTTVPPLTASVSSRSPPENALRPTPEKCTTFIVHPAVVTGGVLGFLGLCVVAIVLVWRKRETLKRGSCRCGYEAAQQEATDEQQLNSRPSCIEC